MKIVVLTNRVYRGHRGAERFLLAGKHLVMRGNDVSIIYVGDSEKYLGATKFTVENGVKVIVVPNKYRVPLSSYFKHLGRTVLECLPYCLREDVDIVHAETVSIPFTGVPTLFTRMLGTARVMIDFVDLWGSGGLQAHRSYLEPSYSTLRTILARMSTAATVVSDFLKNYVMKLGMSPNRVFKIPMGADTDRVRMLPKEEARKILGIDMNSKVVGLESGWAPFGTVIEFMVRVLAEPNLDDSGLKLIFIGDYGERLREKIIGLASELGVTRKIDFSGWLSYSMLSTYLSACDILALPMFDTDFERARFPGRIGDYFAVGRPIVASDVGEVGRVIKGEKCGLVSIPYNAADFAEKLSVLLTDEKLARQMGAKSRGLAEGKYSWRSISQDLEEVYRAVLG